MHITLQYKEGPNAKGHGTEKAIEAVHKNLGRSDFKVVSTLLTIIFVSRNGDEFTLFLAKKNAEKNFMDLEELRKRMKIEFVFKKQKVMYKDN